MACRAGSKIRQASAPPHLPASFSAQPAAALRWDGPWGRGTGRSAPAPAGRVGRQAIGPGLNRRPGLAYTHGGTWATEAPRSAKRQTVGAHAAWPLCGPGSHLKGQGPAVRDGQGALHDGNHVDHLHHAAQGQGRARGRAVGRELRCSCKCDSIGKPCRWHHLGPTGIASGGLCRAIKASGRQSGA